VLGWSLLYRYSGPGSQRVSKTFPMGTAISNWLTYLKSTHRIAVGSLDGRGSSAAGDKLKFEVYRRLSSVELEDQISAGRCVQRPCNIYGLYSMVYISMGASLHYHAGVIRCDTIRWRIFTCAQKLANDQFNLPHGTKQKRLMKKLKIETEMLRRNGPVIKPWSQS